MKLRGKVVFSVLVVSLPPFLAMIWFLLAGARSGLQAEAFAKLESARDNKRAAVERYFTDIEHQILSFSENHMEVDAMRDLPDLFRGFRKDNQIDDAALGQMATGLRRYYEGDFTTEYRNRNRDAVPPTDSMFSHLSADSQALQYHFIQDNPNPLGNKENLDRHPRDASAYGRWHEKFHPVVRNFLRYFGLYDVFLADIDSGTIFYTVFKELDFTTSLRDGAYADTNLGEAFRAAAALTNRDEFILTDYRQYLPSYEDPASFIASPIFDGDRKIGVALFQMPIARLNDIMGERAGLGDTGESYLVGPDFLMRSDSHVDPTNRSVVASFHHPEQGRIDTEAVRAALAGKTGFGVFDGYHGRTVLSTYCPVQVGNFTWALITEIESTEALAAVSHMSVLAGLIALLGVMLIVAGGVWVARSVQKPVLEVQQALAALALGDVTVKVAHASQDEIGDMANACRTIVDINREMAESVSLIAGGDWTGGVQIRSDKDLLGNSLNRMIVQVGETLSRVRSAVEEVSSGTGQIADASQSLSQGATETAASLEEISASATEIGSQAKHNAETATQANQLAAVAKGSAETGSQRMQALNTSMVAITESSAQIAKIIKTIDDIAFQTNILALNAAVEAARAGRHGKGFAVVAEEVRSLAARSAKAARETADLIEGSKNRVDEGNRIAKETVSALAEIVGGIVKVGDLVGEMAAASNEQAQGIAQISQGLGQIDQVTQQNTATAEETAAAAEELSGQADELRSLISQFKLKGGASAQKGRPAAKKVSAAKPPQSPRKALNSTKSTPRSTTIPSQGVEGWDKMAKMPNAKPVSNEEIISLEDNEFGRY